MLFERLKPDQTNITFVNEVIDSPELNIFNYLYFYNGGGVACGDLTGDGLPELYFTSNLGDNRLYLNRGALKFEDITDFAGVQGTCDWSTGVSFVDINADGLLDIYVSCVSDFLNLQGSNQLFINKGIKEGKPFFVEQAADYGLDFEGFGNQAAFFDYDLDGDLDMFQLNHSVHKNGTFGKKASFRNTSHPTAGDRLMRNDNGSFIDITEEAGIFNSAIGYGLGITIADVNLDGYPDIYVGNDFHENDYLYINNQDGTFSELAEQSFGHTSRFSMGNDIGDINNDGYPEIISLDMLPEDPVILKSAAGEEPYSIFDFKLNFGYSYQYSRNALQLNHGNGKFSDIGLFSGVAATDWSWSALFFDADLDGYKDLFVSNGIYRRSNDQDYINFISSDVIQARIDGKITESELELVNTMPQHELHNYVFQNNGDLTFTDRSIEWGFHEKWYSNGTAYSDLDADGDLDIVINNINAPACVYRNDVVTKDSVTNNFIKVTFKGKGNNPFGYGARVNLYSEEGFQTAEFYPTRGYLSSVGHELVFGLGECETIDSLEVIWPDFSKEVLYDLKANQTLKLLWVNASLRHNFSTKQNKHTILENVTNQFDLNYKHEENKFIEFNREPLIPHMNSTEGPKFAVGDINNDGREDFFVGGGKRQRGQLFIQQETGFFRVADNLFLEDDEMNEDVGVEFFDADGDGDLDLIVVSGGNEFSNGAEPMLPRLYMNNGSGGFTKATDRLPDLFITGSCVVAEDFDNDKDPDLFIGARAVPWNYGIIPESYVLRNNGNGYFEIDTVDIPLGLRFAGFVKGALAQDMNGDGFSDLVIASDWMPIKIFYCHSDGFEERSDFGSGLAEHYGWWNCLSAADFDNDGDIDLLGGNLGLNSKFKANSAEPVRMYVKDFDENGKIDQVITYYLGGVETLFADKDELTKQMVSLNKDYLKYTKYANTSFSEIFSKSVLEGSKVFRANEFRSMLFLNEGQGNFKPMPLPVETQFSPVMAMAYEDVNKDGYLDVLVSGNYFETTMQRGRYDASYGNLLIGNGDGTFESVATIESGFLVVGQTRDLQKIEIGNSTHFLVARNNDTPLIFELKK